MRVKSTDIILRKEISTAVGVLLAVGIGFSTLLPSLAESPGVVIHKDGASVNVTIDPSVIPNLTRMERRDGQMTFDVPDASRVQIDPALKNMVQIQGKSIIIKSDQVYLGTQDLTQPLQSYPKPTIQLKPAPQQAAKPAATSKPAAISAPIPKAQPVVKVPATPKSAIMATPPITQPKAATAPVQPKPQPVAKATPIVSQPVIKAAPIPVQPAAKPVATVQPPAPIKTSAPATAQAPVNYPSRPDRHVNRPDVQVSTPAAAPIVANPVPTTEPVVETPTTPATVEVPVATILDPEDQPINLEGVQALPLHAMDAERDKIAQTSMGLIARMMLGLTIVLLLALGFMKSVLPKMVDRYPGFFAHMQQTSPITSHYPGFIPPAEQSVAEEQPVIQAAKSRRAQPVALSWFAKNEPSKKHYIEHLSVAGDRFKVLTSTQLGKGNELHLVEIKGRHLVIATTPFSVNLIKDLGEVAGEAVASESEIAIARTLPMLGTSQSDEMLMQVTKAYLDDEPPISKLDQALESDRQIRKPFASEPVREEAPLPDARELIYKKYLNESAEQDLALQQQRDVTHTIPTQERFNTVDAEDVVVLNDYDDVYRS